MKGKPALIIILISVISLMTAFGLIMAFYISEREFQGEKTLSIVRFTSADEKTEAAGDLKLVSTPDFILIEFDGQACQIKKTEGLVSALEGGLHFCDSETPWEINFGKHYEMLGINKIADLTIMGDWRTYQHTDVFFLAFSGNAETAERMKKQDCIRQFKKLTSVFDMQLDRP